MKNKFILCQQPKILTHSSNSKSEISPKYLKGWGRPMIPLEATFSSCETLKPGKISASKIQWWERHRRDNLTPKGRDWREEKEAWFPRVWNRPPPECRKTVILVRLNNLSQAMQLVNDRAEIKLGDLHKLHYPWASHSNTWKKKRKRKTGQRGYKDQVLKGKKKNEQNVCVCPVVSNFLPPHGL